MIGEKYFSAFCSFCWMTWNIENQRKISSLFSILSSLLCRLHSIRPIQVRPITTVLLIKDKRLWVLAKEKKKEFLSIKKKRSGEKNDERNEWFYWTWQLKSYPSHFIIRYRLTKENNNARKKKKRPENNFCHRVWKREAKRKRRRKIL